MPSLNLFPSAARRSAGALGARCAMESSLALQLTDLVAVVWPPIFMTLLFRGIRARRPAFWGALLAGLLICFVVQWLIGFASYPIHVRIMRAASAYDDWVLVVARIIVNLIVASVSVIASLGPLSWLRRRLAAEGQP